MLHRYEREPFVMQLFSIMYGKLLVSSNVSLDIDEVYFLFCNRIIHLKYRLSKAHHNRPLEI